MPSKGWTLAAAALLGAGVLAGCGATASQSLPAWKAVSLSMLCTRLPDWLPESTTDLRANDAFAKDLIAIVPRIDATDRAVVADFAEAQRAYAQALANEPDVFAVRLRALVRSRDSLDRACREAGTSHLP